MRRLAGALAIALVAGCSAPAEREAPALPADAPARFFDLAHWRLQLPDGSSVRAELLRAGFRSELFFADADRRALVLRCSDAPRAPADADPGPPGTVLREMLDPKTTTPDADANTWTIAQGTTLELAFSVDAVPLAGAADERGRIGVAAVVAASGPPLLEIRYAKRTPAERGHLFATLGAALGGPLEVELVSREEGGLAPGEPVQLRVMWHGTELKFRVTRGTHDPVVVAAPVLPALPGRNLHWVVGVLNPDTGVSSVDERAQVTYYMLSAAHP